MYTIFKNDTSIILTDDRNIIGKEDCYLWIDFNRKEALNALISEGQSKLCFYDADLKGMWDSFKGLFKVIEASGGIVQNEEGEILFIFRNDKWDLPKGKIELNSNDKALIPQVEEGITELSWVSRAGVSRLLQNTYPNIALLVKMYWPDNEQ